MQSTIMIEEVSKPQGVRGEIKIRPLTDRVSDIKRFRTVYICEKEYKVLACRADATAAYLALSGIADRDAAEALRGAAVYALRSEAPALREGRYYIVDMIGCEVFTESGRKLGVVADVTPAHTDIYTLNGEDGEYLFPAADGVLLEIEPENKKITANESRLRQVWIRQD